MGFFKGNFWYSPHFLADEPLGFFHLAPGKAGQTINNPMEGRTAYHRGAAWQIVYACPMFAARIDLFHFVSIT
jgi:hypothetical protein